MQFLFSPLWGRVSDRIGRRPILILGLAGSTLAYVGFGYASTIGNLPLMFVTRIGAGIAGATIATAQAYVADSTTPDRRTAGMAIIGAAFGLGFVFGPLLGAGALLLDTDPGPGRVSGLPGYLAAAFSMLALVLAIILLPESRTKSAEPGRHHHLRVSAWRSAFQRAGVMPLVAAFFLATFAFAIFESTVARFGDAVFGLDLRQNFFLYAYLGFLLLLAQGGVRGLVKRLSPERIGLVGAILLAGGMMGLVVASQRTSTLVLFVSAVILVTGFAFLTTSSQSLLSLRCGVDEQGAMLGLNQSAAALARIVGPIVGNVAFGWKVTYPYALSAGLMLLVLVAFFRLPRQNDSSPQSEESH
jgi:MFS family permease